MAEPQSLKTSLIALIGFVSAIVTFVVVVALQAFFLGMDAAAQGKATANSPASKASQLVAEQEGRLASFAWIDRETGQVKIPIDQAMRLTIAEYRKANPDENPD